MSRASALFAYLVLGACLAVAAGGFVAVWLHQPPAPPSPLKAFAPCRPIVGGPTPVYVCQGSGHAYAVQRGQTVDLGPVSPVPWTPAR